MKLLKKMRYIFSILLVVSLLFSVTPVVHGFMAYEHHRIRYRDLAWKVHRKHWDISYRYGNDCPADQKRNPQELEQAITKALRMWLAPLRPLTKRPIVNDFRYHLNADLAEVDMRITFECTISHSSARLSNRKNPDITLREGTEVHFIMSSIVHEIGHAFGLTDTYSGVKINGYPRSSTGGLKETVGTQPSSVMSAHMNVVGDGNKLGEDDKRGIIWLYKYFFDGLADDCFLPDGSRRFFPQECDYNFLAIDDCFFSDYVFEEDPRGCVPRYPLIFEVKHGWPEYALQLLEEDPQIDVNAQDDAAMTALHYAVMYEKEEVVKALLAHKDIKPSLKDKQGRTPLDIALAAGHTAIIEMFPAIELPRLKEDVNGDGIVNIQDLVLVASNLGQSGSNPADVNGDGIVNIQDLVLVAGALDAGDSAPAVNPQVLQTFIDADVEKWLQEARQLPLTDPAFQRGILILEQLLATLTPKQTALLPNYPNPFNPETWIPYQLKTPAAVRIAIYNPGGVLVRELSLGYQVAGRYTSRARAAYWDGRDTVGEPVASGLYFYTLTDGDFSATRRMVILK